MEIIKKYQWRDSSGDFHYISEMKTKHIFYTWLMIWNHSVPENMRIWNNHQYSFSEFYTSEYMLESFKQLYYELKKRNDIGFKSKEVIKKIETYYYEKYNQKLLKDK